MPLPLPLPRLLRPRVRRGLRAVADPAPPPPLLRQLAALDDALDRVDARLAGLHGHLDRQHGRLDRRSAPFSAEMTVEEALKRHPGAQGVLATRHLPHCSGCAVRFDETLAEVAEAYGLDLGDLLVDLRGLLSPPPRIKG